ncbi:MAG: triose-phosphate isomerase [Bacteroidota bacterium]
MRPYIVAGNWKMNMDAASARALASGIRDALVRQPSVNGVQTIVCPPFPLLPAVQEVLASSGIGLGAQNMHSEESGAFTGEVSPSMLTTIGCSHVILGHSERRQFFHESDAFINAKVHRALAHGLLPIVCVGETLEQREKGVMESVINEQVRGVLTGITAEQMRKIILAYEPVWAIGTGRTASPEQAQEVHGFIRNLLTSLYDSGVSGDVVIQYGGSVKADNAEELFSQPDVDGGLIGGASLNTDQFLAIIRAAEAVSS